MTLLIYIIKSIFISGMLYGYYMLFLRNRRFHDFNRLYILSIPVFSFLLPLLRFSWPSLFNLSANASPIRILSVVQGNFEEAFTIYAQQKNTRIFSPENLLMATSILISIFLLFRLFKAIHYLQVLKKGKTRMQLPDAVLYFVSEKGTPFSFFRSIFWDRKMDISSTPGRQILRHEIFHVKHMHSADLIILELLSVMFWFNPFLFLIRKELKAIHEYGADAYAAADSDEYHYARLLLQNISGSPKSITHPFFKNQIKRRIAMITKIHHKNQGPLGRLMILPLIVLLISVFSFNTTKNHLPFMPNKTIRVIVDAGHGGEATGAESNGVYEKDINLNISKKIRALAKEYQIDVLMTRENDIDKNDKDLSASLTYRTELAKKENADLFISIHANITEENQTPGKKSGFEIYVPENKNPFHPASVQLASIVTENIKKDFKIADEVKQSARGVHVLNHATVPAILIECGFIDNKSDLAYMQDDKYQEKIARDILNAIREYATQKRNVQINDQLTTDTIQPETISFEEMNKINPDELLSLNVDKINNLITINLKNGKKYRVTITPYMTHYYDSARMAESKKESDSSKVFTQVEDPASFPGGQEAWYQYLSKNMKYPAKAIADSVQGTVLVEFIVRKDGTLSDIHAISGPESLHEAAVRTIRDSGKWIPAKQNGIVVDAYTRQPFNFQLQRK